jgi:hypothetical protein
MSFGIGYVQKAFCTDPIPKLINFRYLSHTTLYMPITFLSIFAKAAIRFAVRCSTLKPANFNLHFWTRWTKKITHLRKFICFIIRNASINATINLKEWRNGAKGPIGGIEVVLTLEHNDTPAVVPEDNV